MRLRSVLCCLLVFVGTATAHAVTVTNRDDKDRKLTILEGDNKQDHLLKPNGVLASVCPKGCMLRLGDSEDDEYILEGNELVSIEDNKLYDDAPQGRVEAAPDRPSGPPPPQPAPPASAPK